MYKYKIAAIAKAIFNGLKNIETESCRPAWQYSIYFAICHSVNNEETAPAWENEHSQWNIDHHFRGGKSTIRRNHPGLIFEISRIRQTQNMIMVVGNFSEDEQTAIPFEFALTNVDFGNLENVEEDGERILFAGEIDMILDSMLELETAQVTEEDEEAFPGRTNDKINALKDLLGPIREVYSTQNEVGKSYIETVVGASIFYLPHPVNECFSGYCSIKALNKKINNKNIVKEHITPRKYAARETLDENYPLENFYDNFSERYRRFMYLTAQENRLTVNYAEDTHDQALMNLGIEKFPEGGSPFADNHTYFMKYIAYCRENHEADEILTKDSAMNLLQLFLIDNPI